MSNYNTPTADFSMTKNNLEHQIKIEEEEKFVFMYIRSTHLFH